MKKKKKYYKWSVVEKRRGKSWEDLFAMLKRWGSQSKWLGLMYSGRGWRLTLEMKEQCKRKPRSRRDIRLGMPVT